MYTFEIIIAQYPHGIDTLIATYGYLFIKIVCGVYEIKQAYAISYSQFLSLLKIEVIT